MSIQIPTQPIPGHIAEACAWLSAAERHTGQQLRHRLDAGDVIDILCDVHPPYPPIDTTHRTMTLTDAAPAITQALERAVTTADSVEERLRAARALVALRQRQS